MPELPINLSGTPTYKRAAGASPDNLSVANREYNPLNDTSLNYVTPKKSGYDASSITMAEASGDRTGRFKTVMYGYDNEEAAAQRQSILDKGANGILKGVNLTATTIAGGFGMLYGVGSFAATGRLADIWDNGVMRGLDDWNKEVDDKILPNYYTKAERDAAWYSPDNWLTANFLFDKLIKNAGFAVGAMVSGNIANAGLLRAGAALGRVASAGAVAAEASQAFKIFSPLLRNTARAFSAGKNIEAAEILRKELSSIADVTATSSKLAQIEKSVGAFAQFSNSARRTAIAAYSSAGEASFEALQTGNQFRDSLIQEYVDKYGEQPSGAVLEEINKKADQVGKTSFYGNLALLGATEYVQLPYLLGSSYRNTRQAAGVFAGRVDDVLAKAPDTKLGKITERATSVGRYVFDPKEAGQEIGQYALEVGTQNYFSKAMKSDDADVWVDGFLYGFVGRDEEGKGEGALVSKEGMESFLLGGLTGGPLQARTKAQEKRIKTENTQRFLDQIDRAPSFKEAFQDRMSSVNRGVVLQQQHEAAILTGNELEARDLRTDMMHNYLAPRIKYGRFDMVTEDINELRQMSSSETGLAELKAQGIANVNDTINSFQKRLNNYERVAKNTNDIYNGLYTRYSGERLEDGNPKYSPYVLDKMAYASSKIADYDLRIPQLNNLLIEKGIVVGNLLDDVLKGKRPSRQATAELLNTINDLSTTSDVKDGLKTALQNVISLGERRKIFMEEYEDIKNNPLNYETDPEFNVGDKIELPVSVGEPEKKIEIGKEYSLDKSMMKEGSALYIAPKLTVLSQTLGGELEVKLPGGKIKFVAPEDLKGYNLLEEDNASKELADIMDESIDAVLKKEEYKDLPEMKEGDSKLGYINSLSDQALTDDVEAEFNKRTEEFIKQKEEKIKQQERLSKQKQQIASEQNDLQGDSGNVNTGDPVEGYAKEGKLLDIKIMFASGTSESEKEGYYVDDSGNVKDPKQAALHLRNTREFLNNAANFPNRANLRAILVTPLLEKTYGLDGLTQISYGVKNEDLQTEEQKAEFLKKTTDIDNGFVAQVFVEQVGSDLYFINKNGERLGKLGEQLDVFSLGNVIFQTMRSTSLKDSKGNSKVRSNQEQEAEAYVEAWKKERANIFATDPNASPTIYDFDISRGVAIEGDTPNHVAGTLISGDTKVERQLLKNQSIIQIPTNKAVIFKGRAINFPNGRPVLVYGDNIAFLNNIKLDGKRAELVYSVIEKLANDINERAQSGKKIVFSKTKEAKFLQNILYWKEGKTTEGSNQINISDDGTTISFGGKSFAIAEIAENKNGLIEEINKAFHNVNNKTLSEETFSKPFTEFYLEKGELKTREWNNYQSYLLSSTLPDGSKRTINDTPLSTKIAQPIPDAVPYTHEQKYSTLIGLELPIGVISKPAAKEEAAPAVAPTVVKNKFTYDGTSDNTAPVLTFGNVTFTVKEGEDPQFLEDDVFKKTQEAIVKKLKQNSPESSNEDLQKQANGVILSVVNKEIDSDLKSAQTVVIEPTPVVEEEVRPMAPPEVVAEQELKAKKADIERRIEEIKYSIDQLVKDFSSRVDDFVKKGASLEEATKLAWNEYPEKDAIALEKLRKELAALEGAKPAEKKYDPSKTKKRGKLFRAVSDLDETARMTDEDIEILKNWQAEKLPQIPYEVLEQMVSMNPTRKAWGVYESGIAKFVRGGLRGTEYHEIFHGIWRGLLTAEERAAIVKEFNSREGSFKDRLSGKVINFADATEEQVEDRAADDFSDYRVGKLPARTLGEAVRNFFKRIMDFFKSFVAKPTLKDQLFKDIEQGKFRDRELSPEVRAMAPAYRAAEGLTEEQTNAHVQDMTTLSAAIIFGNGEIGVIDKSAIYDFAKITSKQVFGKIKEIYAEQGYLEQMTENTWNQLVEKTKLSLKANLKVSFTEEDLININDEQYNNRNYAPEPFSVDYKKSAPIGIKFTSFTLPKTKSTPQVGKSSLELPDLQDKNNLYSLVPSGQVFSTVINALNNTSIGKIAGKLFNLAQNDSDYVRFFQRVGGDLKTGTLPFGNFKYNDWRLFVELVKTYTKQKPDATIEYIQGEQVYAGSALITGVVNTTVKGWIQNIRNLAKEEDSIIKFDSVDKAYKITEDISNVKVDKPKEQLEFARQLGIIFPKEVYDRLSPTQKKTDFPKAINAIKNTLQADKQIINVQKKTLDIAGPLNSLAEMLVSVTNPIQASVRTNIDGNQTNSFTDSNTPSVFETTFNEVSTLKELLEIRPELNDVFSRGSQVLKEGGLFFDKEGNRTKLLLKLGYIEGRNNNDTNSGKTITDLTDGEKLALEINRNINGQFYVLIPADGSTEWMMNLGNNIEFSEFELGEAWEKVNDIFIGYLMDDINLALDASNRESIRNVGDRASELRFFGEILSEKHASDIQEMIDDEKSIDDIEAYIKNNLKDKDEVPGIASDIKNFIVGTAEETITQLKNNGVIVYVNEDEFKYESLDSKFATNEKLNKNRLTSEDVNNIVTFVNTNYIISNFEFHKILFGDPFQFALKQGESEETKRIKSFLSPRQITVDLVPFNSFLNDNLNNADGIQLDSKDPGHHEFKSYTNTITFSDVIVASELANNPNLSKEVRDAFMKVNEGDASSILELGTFREVMIKNSQWPTLAEDWYQWQMAYTRQNMPKYEYTNAVLEEHDKALVQTPEPRYVLNVLKPIVTGVKNGENKIELVVDKFSQMPLYYKAVQGTSLENLYLRMIDPNNKIGYAVMLSGRKVGATELYNLYKDGKVNDEAFKGVVEVPWKIYGIQVENGYEGEGFQTRGSQLTKISTLDLYENGEPIGATPERKEAIKAAVNKNTNILNTYHKAKYEGFLKKTGLEDLDGVYRIVDRVALSKALQDEMLRRTLADNIIDSIQTDENGQFPVPFEASSAYFQIRDILYSFIDKSIGSPKMTGGPHVQVPVTGWESASKGRSLAVKTKDGYRKISRKDYDAMEDKSGVILTEDTLKIYEDANGRRYCEVMIPYWFRDLGKLSGKTDAEILKYLNTTEGRKILTGVGFRIPTQALSSAEVFVVKGFLPKAMGKTVVVPSAITTKAGSDFDIDKLNMYLKATYVDRNGNLKLVTLQGDEAQTKAFYAKVFSDSLAGKQMYKAELLEATQILSYSLPDPKNLLEKYGNTLNIALEGVQDTADYEQAIMDEIKDLGDENIQEALREKFADEMYIKALENEYYSSLEELLTLPENFKRIVNPVGDDGLKELSVKLDELRGYDESGIKSKLLNRTYMNSLRSAFLTGKRWVGIVAVNITGQSGTQKSKIYIDPVRIENVKNKQDRKILKYNDGQILLDHNTVEVDGKTYTSISGIYDAKKEGYISDGLSGYATAVVDVSKDPYILKIIKSDLLIGTFMFLRRIGVPKKQLVMFMNQPIISEYVNLLNNKKSKNLFDERYIDDIQAQFQHGIKNDTNTFDKEKLESNISNFYRSRVTEGGLEKGLSGEENAEQIAIFKEFLKYAKMAEFSFNLTQASNYDTTKFRSAESLSGKQYRQEIAEKYNIFSSVDELLRNTHIGEQAMYLDKSTDAVAEYLTLDKPEFIEITDKLMEPYYSDQFLSKDKRIKVGNKMKASLLDFIIQRRSDIAANLTADLVDTATSVASMLTKAKKEFPNVKIINDLEVDSSGRIGGAQTIKLRVNDKSKDSQDMYTGMMRELRDDSRTNALYNGIVKLAILQGTYQSNISIKNIIPIEDYAAKITPIVTGLKADDEIKLFASTYEFQRNEFADDAVVPIVTPRFRELEETSAYNEDAPRRFQAAFVRIWTERGYVSVPGQFPTIQGLGVKTMQRQLLFLNEKYDGKAVNYDVVKVPRALPINKKKLDEGKIDVATGLEITNQAYAEKTKIGDTSLQNFYGYQKVKNMDGSPVIAKYDREGNAIYVYKFINLHGDSKYASEYYGDGRPSVFNNGTQKNIVNLEGTKVSGEIPDGTIANYFMENTVSAQFSNTSNLIQQSSSDKKKISPEGLPPIDDENQNSCK
jgi:hypothetical protein